MHRQTDRLITATMATTKLTIDATPIEILTASSLSPDTEGI
jgi:hypothetical protein